MSDPRELPLAELARRVRAARGTRALRRWLAWLAEDGRAGARALAGRVERELRARETEQARLARLFAHRRRLRRNGARRVAGVDEVGVGPLAGPVVAAAVVLAERAFLPRLDDSKRLPAEVREELAREIRARARAVSVAEVWMGEIDRLNVYRAGIEAMRRAVAALAPPPDHVLVDARVIPDLAVPQTGLPGGDRCDANIAAASIVAKVHRDAVMCRLDRLYPGYGFARHKGYATPEHLAALRRLGPCRLHRRSFAPVAQLELELGSP